MIRIVTTAALLAIAATTFAAHDIIVESREGGKNVTQYLEIDGAWTDSNIPPDRVKSLASGVTAGIGTRKIELPDHDIKTPGGTARFFPQLPAPAESYVYVTWPAVSNVMPVQFIIHHAAGETELVLRQDGLSDKAPNGHKWLLLGKFRFTKGDTQFVDMKLPSMQNVRPTTNRRSQFYSDAMRFTSAPLAEGVALSDTDYFEPPAGSAVAAKGNGSNALTPVTQPIDWTDNINAAYSKGAAEGRRLLVFFFAPDCRVSSQLESKVFTDTAVRKTVAEGFIPVKLNHSQNAQLAAQLKALKSGTVVIVTPAKQSFDTLKRIETPNEFLDLLK